MNIEQFIVYTTLLVLALSFAIGDTKSETPAPVSRPMWEIRVPADSPKPCLKCHEPA